MAENDRHLFEELLDYVVYVPVGLALKALEEVPSLAAEGRARLGKQIDNARVLGRFSVGAARARGPKALAFDALKPFEGLKAIDALKAVDAVKAFGAFNPFSARCDEATTVPIDGDVVDDAPALVLFDGAAEGATAFDPEKPLAIPDYDALSASQVVPRLRGLSGDELEAIEAYERATRRRRTIIGRVAQLRRELDGPFL